MICKRYSPNDNLEGHFDLLGHWGGGDLEIIVCSRAFLTLNSLSIKLNTRQT
jgi:hypothetical protein